MLKDMFVFEWRYFTKQPSFYVTSLIFFFLTFFATVSENVQIGGGGNVLYNGPFSIAQTLLIMGLFAMFLVVNFVANTAIRNDTTQMSELLYSKPIKPISYQLGRFLGSFAVVATVFAFVPLGIYLGCVIGGLTGWVDAERLGVSHLNHYIAAYFYISLPTLLVLSSFFYAVAIRFRSMMAVYLVASALMIIYEVSGQFVNEPEYRTIVALADPFGFNTFAEITRYWTMHDKNNTPIVLEGLLLQNRLIWLSISIAILMLFGGFSRKVSLRKPTRSKKVSAKPTQDDDISRYLNNTITYKSKAIENMAHLGLRIKFEIKQVIFSPPFIILSLLTIFLLVAPLVDPRGMFGTPNWPVTQAMVMLIMGSSGLLMAIVVAYYSAEIVWRERNSGMGDIIDSMPVNSITFWLSKIIAITLVMVLLYCFSMGVTIVNQVLRGQQHIEILQYVIRLSVDALLPFIFTAVLAFLLQVLSPNKYIGMLLFVLYFIFSITISNFGFSHHMFRFASSPTLFYSDINQYGNFLSTDLWFKAYWFGLVMILSALTYALWHRGPAQTLKSRIKKVGYYLGNTGKGVIVLGLAIFVSTGSYIHYNTRVLNEYVVLDDQEENQAEYEKSYVGFKQDSFPTITQTHVYADIFPSERRIEARAEITIANNTQQAMSQFLVSHPSFTPKWSVDIEGGSLGEVDERFNSAWFTFDKPLEAGDTRKGVLKVTRAHQGFSDGNNDFSLVENGTFINNFELFPVFGYREDWQLVDSHKRRKYGLEPLKRANDLDDTQFYNESFFGAGVGFIDFEATITTSEDQFAIAPGYLQSETLKDGRRRYHYKMDAPMVNFYSIMSAQLSAKKEQYKGIDIEVYYHPYHAMNVDRMIESVRDSIDYFSEHFGPYQHKQMRIIEFPGYRAFAQSFANTVPYSEEIGFITDLRDPENIDPVYYVTAHEVAHQWWGHQVGAANVQGSAIISESLSQYSALMIMEKKYGEDKLRKFLTYELDRYLQGRSVEIIEEMPFMRSENQQYIHYNKGSVVMMSIKDRLGEQRLNQALSSFLAAYRYQSTPYPTTRDLFSYITQDATEQEKVFITNLFEHITLYDLKTSNVLVAASENGEFDVTLTIDAKLIRADGQGLETEEAFEDHIDIGLFSENPENITGKNAILYLEKHLIKSGTNTITISLPSKPSFAGVDPFVRLVDRDSADNIYRIN
ncbi:ABC transporter permease/M1 family aminopeptidase [Shewanella sp.]|uniref:ABC transporter permease/M1 family aminopeptidase n=1 Tax=Shewanella sp. TaxID=50422 RepID=UPI0040542FC0